MDGDLRFGWPVPLGTLGVPGIPQPGRGAFPAPAPVAPAADELAEPGSQQPGRPVAAHRVDVGDVVVLDHASTDATPNYLRGTYTPEDGVIAVHVLHESRPEWDEAVYRQRVGDDGIARMIADNDAAYVRRNAGAYNPLTRAYLRTLRVFASLEIAR